mmetsp:Transcript_11521/g.32074  ORF Transcript_11521/g.32074 Transcript_11521/m.32074 type:complete len:107 (-) Transcript_11521:17-337(-)
MLWLVYDPFHIVRPADYFCFDVDLNNADIMDCLCTFQCVEGSASNMTDGHVLGCNQGHLEHRMDEKLFVVVDLTRFALSRLHRYVQGSRTTAVCISEDTVVMARCM